MKKKSLWIVMVAATLSAVLASCERHTCPTYAKTELFQY